MEISVSIRIIKCGMSVLISPLNILMGEMVPTKAKYLLNPNVILCTYFMYAQNEEWDFACAKTDKILTIFLSTKFKIC